MYLNSFNTVIRTSRSKSAAAAREGRKNDLIYSDATDKYSRNKIQDKFHCTPRFNPAFLHAKRKSLTTSAALTSLSTIRLRPKRRIILPGPTYSFESRNASRMSRRALFRSTACRKVFFETTVPSLEREKPSLQFTHALDSPSPLVLIGKTHITK